MPLSRLTDWLFLKLLSTAMGICQNDEWVYVGGSLEREMLRHSRKPSPPPKKKSDCMLKKCWENLDLPCADILEVALCIHAKVCSGALCRQRGCD